MSQQPNPDYIDCDKDETIFQWGDGNLAASLDASHGTVDQAATERFRFENGEWVKISPPENKIL